VNTSAPDDANAGEARLQAWMMRHVAGFRGPPILSKFTGGQSNPTYRIDSPSGAYVLRRKPLGIVLETAHAIDREYRVIEALHPTGFAVPKPYALCLDERILGVPFYVMECVSGRNWWDGDLPELSPAERTSIYFSMIDKLAALHSIDHRAVGLADFGKGGNYFDRQVKRWSGQYRSSQSAVLVDMNRLIEWLPRTVPPEERTAIVHGDFKIDNLLFGLVDTRIVAVLDWELSTLGDPVADLSYLLLNWVEGREARSSVASLDLDLLGIPRLEVMVARYCKTTKRSFVPRLDWYFCFHLFRLACILQGIEKRIVDGTASSAQASAVVGRVPRLAARAWDFAVRAGA
jgi:aminoglycoside phosphotransferase (APT) family kinase protein